MAHERGHSTCLCCPHIDRPLDGVGDRLELVTSIAHWIVVFGYGEESRWELGNRASPLKYFDDSIDR